MLPGICGILAGSLYRLNLFRIRKAKVVSENIGFHHKYAVRLNIGFRSMCNLRCLRFVLQDLVKDIWVVKCAMIINLNWACYGLLLFPL